MKHPHPSGRPICPQEKRYWVKNFNYPAETYATPRLRSKVLLPVSADAIGYVRTEASGYGEELKQPVGFVHFK